MSKFEYIRDVASVEYCACKCIGCKMCVAVCPQGVFALEDGKAKIVNKDSCMECGACMVNCPKEAINVKTGVGCASGIINGIIRGTEPTCDCGGGASCC